MRKNKICPGGIFVHVWCTSLGVDILQKRPIISAKETYNEPTNSSNPIHLSIHCNTLQYTVVHQTYILIYIYVFIFIKKKSVQEEFSCMSDARLSASTFCKRDQNIVSFGRISSLLYGSFAKETYNFNEPTNSRNPIHPLQHAAIHCRASDIY